MRAVPPFPSVPSSLTNAPRLIEPRLQTSYGSSGCSPQGLVAVRAEVGNRVVVVGLVDEEDPRLAGLPGTMDDHLPNLTGAELPGDLLRLGMQQIVQPVG